MQTATVAKIEEESGEEPAARTKPRVSKAVGSYAQEHAFHACDCMIDLAAAFFDIPGRELRRPGRTTDDITRVRQIAMYLAHVMLGLSMGDIGRAFGRDRTTVMHACHLVEDMRDDIEIDALVCRMERLVEVALQGNRLNLRSGRIG